MKSARVQFLRSWLGFLSQRGMVLISCQSLDRLCWMLDGINVQILANCHYWPGLATLSFLKYVALGKNKGLKQQNGNQKTQTQYKMLKPPWTKQNMGTCGGLRKKTGRLSNFIVQSRSRIVIMQTPAWSRIAGRWKTSPTYFSLSKLDRLIDSIQQLLDEAIAEAVASCQTRGKHPLGPTKMFALWTVASLGFPVTASRLLNIMRLTDQNFQRCS